MGVAGALLEAAARGDAARLASILKADDRDVNVTDEIGRSALQRAAAEGHVQAVQLLLQHGADPNHQDSVYGNTAAHEAAWKGYSSTLQVLGRSGADLRVLNNAGFTALHFACQNGHNQSCRELLLAGAPPDLQNTYGDTALHTAARYGHAGVSRILVSAACGVSRANRNGDSALHIAAAMGRRKLTRVLLDAGAARALRNQQGETARDIAARKGLADILRILDAPAAAAKPDKKRRGKSKERTLDEPAPDNDRAKDKKKKKSVHFEAPPAAPWSPYGCHYYPDPKFFPKPRLDSLPPDPLRKGEQYYLDLAGNIKKGPVGAGYACYCAPFFKHMEHKLDEDKRDLKRHIDRAHERLDRKVTDLEARTHGQISELTRAVAAERALCLARHRHLEQWVARGAAGRASERPRRPPHSPRGSLHVPPLKRTRSLEILDTDEWNRVHKIIQSFNENCERFETDAKDLSESRVTSKSSEALDRRAASPARRPLAGSRSSERLDARERRLPAEPHVIDNEVFESQSPLSIGMSGLAPRYPSSRRSEAKSPVRPPPPAADMQKEPAPAWKSQVLQRTADDIKKRVELEREMSEVISRNDKSLDISQDGYVRLRKHQKEEPVARESRKSVQELVAQVEQQRCKSPSPLPFPRTIQPTERAECPPPAPPHPPHPSILKMSQQPQRPAPVLKEKPPKSKRFSLHNLIPFPTRKTFQPPPRDNGNESESSDEEDHPIRSTAQPGPARNASLLQTLPLPNYEAVSNGSPSPGLPIFPHDCRPMVPKDAYFHEIPNRQMPYRDLENGPAQAPRPWDYNRAGLPPPAEPRSRNPLQPQTGVFDAMMHDHVLREMERAPHCYSERLHQNTEVEIANRNGPYRGAYCDNGYSAAGERGLLHTRLQSLAINTQLAAGAGASQPDRESHNDSGYSTKVSQGPSPSLSGAGPLGTSSLV